MTPFPAFEIKWQPKQKADAVVKEDFPGMYGMMTISWQDRQGLYCRHGIALVEDKLPAVHDLTTMAQRLIEHVSNDLTSPNGKEKVILK